MNKNNLIKVIISLFLIFLASFLYSILNTNNKNVKKGIDYSNILNEANYKKVGINPEKYKKFEDFLLDFKTFTGVTIDPVNDNFVIGNKLENGNIDYIGFNHKKIKQGFLYNDKDKNLAILDIYKSYKKGMIFGGYGSKSGGNIIFEEDVAHPETYILNGIFAKEKNIFNILDDLKKSKNLPVEKKELLAYLEGFIGDYKEAKNIRLKLCDDYKFTCDKNRNFTLEGKILDKNNNPISDAKIELLNDNKITTFSDNDGKFTLTFKFYSFSHLRFKASKTGYSDGFNTVSYNTYSNNTWINKENLNFNLTKSQKIYTVNSSSESKKINKFGKDYYVFKSSQSTYLVPSDGLYFFNGKKYIGKDFSVYLYEFNKWSKIDNLANVDTFNPVAGYVGNIMKTFGMPYIQFIDNKTGKELFVLKSNPMILKNNIYHMKELYDNYDGIYQAITDQDMKTLVNYSKEKGGFPITFNYLTKNNFLRWPVWWVLDRKKGIWNSVGSRVLTVDGLVELPFYSIKD